VGRVSTKIWSEAPNNSMQRTALRVAADADRSASALVREPSFEMDTKPRMAVRYGGQYYDTAVRRRKQSTAAATALVVGPLAGSAAATH
jgi:hypothetical protein